MFVDTRTLSTEERIDALITGTVALDAERGLELRATDGRAAVQWYTVWRPGAPMGERIVATFRARSIAEAIEMVERRYETERTDA